MDYIFVEGKIVKLVLDAESRFVHSVNLYAHKSCFPYLKCYSCRTERHNEHEKVNLCSDCLKKLKKQKAAALRFGAGPRKFGAIISCQGRDRLL